MSDTSKKHGGARAGAGRKTKYEKTVVMRVPEKYKEAIQHMIAHLDESAYIDKNYPKGAESTPLFIRSLDDNAQNVTIAVKPILKS